MMWDQVLASRAQRMRASEIRELLKLLDQPDIISFAGGIPDASLFPAAVMSAAYGRVLGGAQASAALQYSVSEGYLPLRQWIAGEMAKLGIACDAEHVFITSGSQQALDYLGKMFLSPGDTALVTFPAYLGALQAFNAYEPTYARLTPFDNTPAAAQASAAEAAGGRVKFAYCVPDFDNPTGRTMTGAERDWLLDRAAELDIAIIEDAAYQALRYEGEAVPSILSLDLKRNGGDIEKTRTLYCGSFSKTLVPGLRVGWVVGASPIIRRLVLAKQAADLHSPSINQMVISEVVQEVFPGQIDRIRAVYGARRDRMLAALAREMPQGVTWTRPDGGMFLWLTLPEGVDGAELLARSVKTERVAFVPGRAFHADGSGANTIRLSFSCASDTMIDEGVARLGRLLKAG
jgi:DNA-binding transcriptional MocR family regulator